VNAPDSSTSSSTSTTPAASTPTPTPVQAPVSVTPVVATPTLTTPAAPTTTSPTTTGALPGVTTLAGATTLPGASTIPRASTIPGITISSLVTRQPAGRSGRTVAGSAGSSLTAGSPLSVDPLTLPLAPATAQLGDQAAARPARAHSHSTLGGASTASPSASSPATVISHFIAVIPTAVWIALAIAFGMAATAAGAAITLGRRASRRATEVAAVTAAALTDQLTGVLNRRGFTQAAERELERARRYDRPLALAYVDVRGLKAVNDSEGHLAGDRLLRQVADLLSHSARTHDLVGRMGGDELAVLLPEQAASGAAAMSERVRERVPARRQELGLRTRWDVTIGTASFSADGDTLEELIAAADRRMYEERGIELRRSS
jgi:diguanylate cyclase (GGDEF)-like protein